MNNLQPIEIWLIMLGLAFAFSVLLAIAEIVSQYAAYMAQSRAIREAIARIIGHR